MNPKFWDLLRVRHGMRNSKSCMGIKLEVRNVFTESIKPLFCPNYSMTRMLMRDLFAVADLVVNVTVSERAIGKVMCSTAFNCSSDVVAVFLSEKKSDCFTRVADKNSAVFCDCLEPDSMKLSAVLWRAKS